MYLRELLFDKSEQKLTDGIKAFSTKTTIAIEGDPHANFALAVDAFGSPDETPVFLGTKGLVLHPHGHAEFLEDLD